MHFTDRELDVMSILWRRGDATVAEVRAELSDDLAYTSVLSVLRLLEQKGGVGHRKDGRAFRYVPLVEPEDAGRTVLQRVLSRLYQGSAPRLLAQLVSDRRLSPEELREMQELLDRHADSTADPGGQPGAPAGDADADGEGG